MEWTFKWRKELDTGQYWDLLDRKFIKDEADFEPGIEGFEFYYDAFRELSTSRPVGMGIAPIPFTAIAEYSRIYSLPDFDDFAYIIRVMDTTFIKLSDAEKKSVGDKDGSTNTNPPNPDKGRHGGKSRPPGTGKTTGKRN